MKDRTWLMVTIVMGLALIISLGYSLKLRRRINEQSDMIVSRSIVQITASNVSIKNVLKAKGNVEKISNNTETSETNQNNTLVGDIKQGETNIISEYHIIINLNEDTIKKVKVSQSVEINIKNEENILKYKGKVTKIIQDEKQKSAIIQFKYDDKIKENQEAECTIIIEEAKDIIALPIVAIKKRILNNTTDNTQNEIINQNQSNITNDTNNTNTVDNKPKEEKYVIVVNDDGTTSEVVVETGISDEYYVEIVSGLSEGQKVQIEEE